ncbi:hypothetical protein EAF04_006465 [Stromatinia cepivora]|nr:hypothetical protein EAF04_006465 [Stromatinia cepivora]
MNSISKKDQNLSDKSDNQTDGNMLPLAKMETLSILGNPPSPNIRPSLEISKKDAADLESVDPCAICTEDMNASEDLTKMRICCWNLFHSACLRTWVNSTTELEQLGTCPMCRHVLPDIFIDMLFDDHEAERVLEPCRCCERDDMEMIISARELENLTEEQKNALRDLYAKLEEEVFGNSRDSERPRNRLRVTFFLCNDDPLGDVIQMRGDSCLVAIWRRLMALLNRALLQVRSEEQEPVCARPLSLLPAHSTLTISTLMFPAKTPAGFPTSTPTPTIDKVLVNC